MYTKCPECKIAFRVTAKVLQQANGNVRCGSCAHSFNALIFLSEDLPASSDGEAKEGAGSDLAEASRRLLETLDELAGPDDVLIEDTGVEWRVLDESDTDSDSSTKKRYDDNTPLPDEIDDEAEIAYSPPTPQRRTTDHVTDDAGELARLQGDLALSDPDDWTDLLEEVSDPESDLLEIEEELAAIHSQLSTREEPAIKAAAPNDLDAQFDTQAEAMGLEISDHENALADQVPLPDEKEIGIENEPAKLSDDEPDAENEDPGDESDDIEPADDDSGAEDQNTLANEDEDHSVEIEDGPRNEPGSGLETTGEFEAQIGEAARALAGEAGAEAADSIDSDDANEELALVKDPGEDNTGVTEHFVPPQTEEEMTVNMEIDQEMMAMATTDDEFSATLLGIQNPEQLFSDNAELVETIIMEGEFVRDAVEEKRIEEENAAKGELDDPTNLADTYALSRDMIRGGRRKIDPPGYGVIAAVILLSLALAVQYVHNSRQSLATLGLFNQTVAPIYRMLGKPVIPEWNIKGWQFEATSGSVAENEATLTIVSRLINRAEQPLPYPLVHVSLTDRWEDIMGSRILEPGDYLAGDLDPSKPVRPGENFTAVITIEEPSAEATGFKLNVCYRVGPGTVRCAIEDFKN